MKRYKFCKMFDIIECTVAHNHVARLLINDATVT